MRKFATIASALMLGSMAFIALATVTADPQNNTYQEFEYVSITSPANPDDYYQTFLNQVQLSFGSTPISLVKNGPKVTFSYNDGEPQECELSIERNPILQTYSLKAYFGPEWGNEPGLYKVNFPAGIVTDGSAVNAAADFEWYMVATTDKYTVSPESGEYSYTGTTYPIVATGDLKEIKITFDGYKSVAINNHSWDDITVYYAPEEDKINQYGNLSLGKDAVFINGNVASITLPEVGEYFYQIWIPDMDFVIDDDYINETIVLYYHAWNGLPEPEVLSAPAAVSGPYPNPIMLTWDYRQLTPTENGLSVVATWGSEYSSAAGWFGYYDIPADAIRLVNRKKPGEGGGISPTSAESGNVLVIDLVPYVKIENENVHNVKVTIPAGIVMNTEGQRNSQISFEFDIYNIYPEDPVCTQSGQPGIYEIEWPDVSNLDATEGEVLIINGADERFELSQGSTWDGETGEGQYRVAYDEGNDSWSLQVNLNGMNILGGEYELVIPEGLIVISDYNENFYTNGYCCFTVEVPGAPFEEGVIYVLGNFNNYTISNKWKLVLDDEYNGYNGFFENVPAGNLDFYLDYLDIIIIPAEGEDIVEFTNNTFEGSIDYSMAPDAAHWTIANWPGGSLNIHVDDAEDIIYIYAFPNPSDILVNPDYTATYEKGIITIAWEGVDDVWFENYTASYLLDANGNEIGLKAGIGAPLQSFSEKGGIGGITLDMTALDVDNGEYTLVIPEGTLQVVSGNWENWDYNPAISYKFIYEYSAGVNGISTDGNIEVYNLQGVRILKSNDTSAVSTLENGIYIINGKKVIIRK